MSIVAAIVVPHPPLLIPGIGDDDKPAADATQRAFEQAARFVATTYPETLVIFSPHATLYGDYFHVSPGIEAIGDFGRFVRSNPARYRSTYDAELVAALTGELQRTGVPGGTSGERDATLDHGTMLPLHFLQTAGVTAPIVRVGLSDLSLAEHWRFGTCVARAIAQTGRRAAIVASGDLSHYLKTDGPYGYREEGARFDAAVCTALRAGDFASLLRLDERLCKRAGECGLRSLILLGGALEGLSINPRLLSYEGPFGVGYAVATFAIGGEDA
jgi:aromatic ring-opening dioxygenase LigB subunit